MLKRCKQEKINKKRGNEEQEPNVERRERERKSKCKKERCYKKFMNVGRRISAERLNQVALKRDIRS